MPTTEAQRRAMRNYNVSEKGRLRKQRFYEAKDLPQAEYRKIYNQKRYQFTKQLKEYYNMFDAFC